MLYLTPTFFRRFPGSSDLIENHPAILFAAAQVPTLSRLKPISSIPKLVGEADFEKNQPCFHSEVSPSQKQSTANGTRFEVLRLSVMSI
jgi:hypothetical protein